MTEYHSQIISFARVILVALFGFFYGLGGISGKWKRRFIAPFILVSGLVAISIIKNTFTWLIPLYYPLLAGALSMGYGADDFWAKVAMRGVYGSLLAIASLPVAFATGQWLMFVWNIVLCIQASIILGVFNPVKARDEEMLIAVLSVILPVFMV